MASTRQRIIESAVACLAETPQATLAQIAEAAAVSRMTLHRHFKNRELLRDAVQHHLVAQTLALVQRLAASDTEARDQLRLLLEACVTRQNGYHILVDNRADHHDHDRETCPFSDLNRRVVGLIQTLQMRGEIAADLPVDWIYHSFDGVIFAAWECQRQGSVAPRDVPRLAWQTFARGVFCAEPTHPPEASA